MELSSFVRPEVWEQLSAHYRTREAVCLRAPAPAVNQALLSWEDPQLEAVLRLTALFGPGSFRVVTQGSAVRPAAYRDRAGWVRWEAIQQLQAARASFNLTRLEGYSNGLLAFSRALETELQCPVQINLYVTPGEAQGLGAHTDSHDVLVYQLRGRKTWNVAGIGAGSGSTDDLTLQPGDWLLVPRGIRHEVKNLEREPTAHLAIGFHPLTWGDMWHSALEHARKTLPLLADAVDPTATSATAARRLAIDILPLLSATDPATARRQYHHTFRNFAAPVPPDHVLEPRSSARIDVATVLGWRASDATVRPAAEFLEVDLSYRRAPLALRPDLAPAIQFITSRPHFRPSDVPGLEAMTAVMLCRLLAEVGALRVLS